MSTTTPPSSENATKKFNTPTTVKEEAVPSNVAVGNGPLLPPWPNFLLPPTNMANASDAAATPNQMPFPFFNPAAFAAAAAAFQKQTQNLTTADGNTTITPFGANSAAMGTPVPGANNSTGVNNSTPRKRQRSTEDGGQPTLSPGVGAGNLTPVAGVGGIGAKIEAAAAAAPGGGVGAGVTAAAWPQAPINVLTPSLFGGEMSNQERKERRKIRNRLSAQQHRERQRERVDTLEVCLRERDNEIVKLREQVSMLTEKNGRLTSRVLQLEAGSCPTLDHVLSGLDDESAAAAASVARSNRTVMKEESIVAAQGPAINSKDPSVTVQDPSRSTNHPGIRAKDAAMVVQDSAVGMEDRADIVEDPAIVVKGPMLGKVSDGGITSDTDGVTTDQAHSSSESDSDDLSPLSTLGGRTGGHPQTPPLSPAASPLHPIDEYSTDPRDSLDGLLLSEILMEVEQTTTQTERAQSREPSISALARASSADGVGVGVGFGDSLDSRYEDDLTIAALDPMEIDALLMSADGANTPSLTKHDEHFAPVANAAVSSGAASPRELEEGTSAGNPALSDGAARGRRSILGGIYAATAGGSRSSSAPCRARGVSEERASAAAGVAAGSVSRGPGVASTVAAGVMGALCLAGVVINSGTQGGGSTSGKELVVSSGSHDQAGRRILSSTVEDDEDVDGEYINVTSDGSSSWVFHPVEAEPWRWRATALRERRAPWVWERALDLFGKAGTSPVDPREQGCDSATLSGVQGSGGELVRSDHADRRYMNDGVEVYRPIAPPPTATALPLVPEDHSSKELSAEDLADFAAAYSRKDLEEFSGDILDFPEESSENEVSESSGKELDLYRYSSWTGGGGVGGAGERSGGDVGDGLGSRAGSAMRFPADRTSYMFCPEAHGMMSGGMIERASKATYDYHHPGARPCPSEGALSEAARGGRATHGKLTSANGGNEVQINVVDLQRSDLQRLDSSSSGLRLLPGENNPHHSGSMALVSAASRNLNFNSNGNDVGGEEGRRRRRGPTPIHGNGGTSLHDDDTDLLQGHKGFHRHGQDYSEGEYLTMLVPSDALDWGSSSLAVRAALNATTSDETGSRQDGQEGGAWVEIGCQVLSARLVQDVTFSG